MPIYYLFMFKLSAKFVNSIENLLRGFFWEGSKGDASLPKVNWGKTQPPEVMGSLGIGNLYIRKDALLAKWIWRFSLG